MWLIFHILDKASLYLHAGYYYPTYNEDSSLWNLLPVSDNIGSGSSTLSAHMYVNWSLAYSLALRVIKVRKCFEYLTSYRLTVFTN